MHQLDAAAAILRAALAVVMLAHGWNHLYGPGGIDGTARWFGSMGLKPPRLHALASGVTELGAGAGLLLGLGTSLMCGAVVGVMVVAFVTAHRSNGFFIFKPGQGYEYVGFLVLTAIALGILGPGQLSLDDALGIAGDLDGGVGLGLSAGVGLVASIGLLAACWRPEPTI
jgi:putative oxidoreductase